MAQSTDSRDENTSENRFFYHSSWPARWSHPEFTDSHTERYKRWSQQPWFKDGDRSAVQLVSLADDEGWPWGFFIYRTVYTPESDQVWSACLEKINRYIHWEIDHVDGDRYAGAEDHSSPERLVHEGYKCVILEDKERWDGASIKQIREDFKNLVAARGAMIGEVVPRYTVCLVIDQHCLDSIMNAFEEPAESMHGGGPRMGFITMVDPMFVPGFEGYFGFMRVEIDRLWWLTVELCSSSSMRDICPEVQPGKIPVYNADLGYADDDPSWTGPRPVTPITHRSICKGDCREHLGMQQ
ncbi:hypothetical protein CNMCM8980_010651 [Aspergillus fumigatiaffinis]|jgi:hypothetical protein|uniref:Uncharacterized protein n=1 Tax=Aspergillus fumigatiaffinis TaxID=340414 RepID=A0A8H4H4L7_9EURO|nr:hypothetical protein CNMCM5878_008465 [Aspergillus fumigatiaffinis]KAF4231958.1 hypothetical protein CNMCM6457_004937 [Aspergillus fumigatiaffinis]KAF4235181.1 hypothetical protein CNMCM6805_008251 [Aspergillus fumigatiaffinis]KAF4250710.1 hypothetical protein CNMCM8980_010651 [Aspergillus fumigatiaffinis]